MKAIIFDMDGVLINTEPLHFKCWKILMEEDGINLTYDIYKPCIGSTREYLIQLLEESFGKLNELYRKVDGYSYYTKSILAATDLLEQLKWVEQLTNIINIRKEARQMARAELFSTINVGIKISLIYE